MLLSIFYETIFEFVIFITVNLSNNFDNRSYRKIVSTVTETYKTKINNCYRK